jgi:hypothetical protein
MKTNIVLLISLSVALFQCSTEAEITKSPIWGVDYSAESTTGFAQGSIEQQTDGTKTIYIVSSGELREGEENFYTVSFTFENGGSLQLGIIKKTADYNYHFPGNESANQLVSATFNGKALDLTESSISIQPDLGDNKLHIITKMHTLNVGDLNGMLSRIPLLKRATS